MFCWGVTPASTLQLQVIITGDVPSFVVYDYLSAYFSVCRYFADTINLGISVSRDIMLYQAFQGQCFGYWVINLVTTS